MAADALAPCITRTSSPLILTIQDKPFPVFYTREFQLSCTITMLQNDTKTQIYLYFSKIKLSMKRVNFFALLASSLFARVDTLRCPRPWSSISVTRIWSLWTVRLWLDSLVRMAAGQVWRYQRQLDCQFNSSSPGQNGRHFAEDIFICMFLNEKFCIFIWISLKFVPNGPIDKKWALVQLMAWRRIGSKPLPFTLLYFTYLNQCWSSWPTHICSTRGRWVEVFIII